MARLRAAPSSADRERGLAVERALEAQGFAPASWRLAPADEPLDAAVCARLAAALLPLEPVFRAFGRYLATRPDLLPAAGCLALEEIPDHTPAAPFPVVARRIEAELGGPLFERFAGFEETPVEARLLAQVHRAWLPDGRPATVRVALPGLEEEMERDLPLLPLLRRTLPERAFPWDETIADFRQALADQVDFALQADALEALARDAAASDLLAVPRVVRPLTAPRVLTVESLAGEPVAGALADEAASYDLARRAGLLWLQQALTCRKLPLEAELARLDDGRLALLAGVFADTHGASQANLWEYLRATAAQEPDRIFNCLLREAVPLPGPRGDLRKRIRQVVPFREAPLSLHRESLAEHLLTHWRLLRQCGYRPQVHLQAFYRGLLRVARLQQRLAPAGEPPRDPLRDALEDLQWLHGWAQLRQLADPRRMTATFESYLTAMAVLPQRIERALDRLEREAGGTRLSEAPAGRPGRDSSATVAALGMAMAGIVLLVTKLSSLPEGVGGGVEPLGAMAFLALGALLLRSAGGRRKR